MAKKIASESYGIYRALNSRKEEKQNIDLREVYERQNCREAVLLQMAIGLGIDCRILTVTE